MKRSKPTGMSLLVALLLLVGCASHSPLPPMRVEQSGYVLIGGIEQWITVRGSNRSNPILLVVHGGPGDPQSPLAEIYAPYEAEFVVVQWDQRGAGQTFGRNRGSVKELSLDRMAQDGVEVAQYLCQKLQRRQVMVLGHSWGTTLATAMVKRQPALFAAYVGTGQVASWRAAVAEQWTYLQSAARAAQDRETLAQLAAIGEPDPFDRRQYFSWRNVLNRKYLAAPDAAWLQRIRTLAAAAGPEQLKDLVDGGNFSGQQLLPVMMATDHTVSASQMPIPFYIIQGRADWFTPTRPAIEYFERVQTPTKQLFVIEDAGHFALATHQEQFLQALIAVKRASNQRQ